MSPTFLSMLLNQLQIAVAIDICRWHLLSCWESPSSTSLTEPLKQLQIAVT